MAGPADLDAVVRIMSLAFDRDPTWSWAFPDDALRQDQYALFWRLMVSSAMRYPWVLVTAGAEAAASWIPPGGTELTKTEEAGLPDLLGQLVGERAHEVLELLERFDAAHPQHEPHYFLSLLGTHPAHSGRGLGMALLAESLLRIDREGMPAYLESSNPANNVRYQRHGFEPIVEFFPPRSEVPITGMWRPAQLSTG